MKLISWNVNGLRAVLNKGFMDFFKEIDADIFCLQETKMQEGQVTLELEGYYQYFNSAVKKGYSGTAIFTKIKPKKVSYGIGIEENDQEGIYYVNNRHFKMLLNIQKISPKPLTDGYGCDKITTLRNQRNANQPIAIF